MWSRMYVLGVIYASLLLHIVLQCPTSAAPFNWSHVDGLNIPQNISGNLSLLPELWEQGMEAPDYQYNIYEDPTSDTNVTEDYHNNGVEDYDIVSEEYLVPPDLGVDKTDGAPRDVQKDPPEYMLDLYNRFSHHKPYVHPTSNIVRSFMNVNQNDFYYNGTMEGEKVGNHTRVHKLVFNITSISKEEEIDYAMLRLYTLVQQDRSTYLGVDRIVSVLQDRGRDLEPEERYETLSSRHIYGHNSGWEAFDVTSAVRRWAENISCVQILEVRIESVFDVVSEGDMDIDTDPKHRNEPLLVIFSNNHEERKLREKELHELISHELDGEVEDEDESDSEELTRVKRKARRNSCRRKPMYVSFKEIKWDMWIIAPPGYQAFECVGKCYFPLNDHLTPTKHAIIQTLFHNSRPKEVSRACCVPTKLNPISILYTDDNDVITYKYKYDGMQVAQCGCR